MNSLTRVTKTNLRDVKASVSDGRQATGKYGNWKFVDEAFREIQDKTKTQTLRFLIQFFVYSRLLSRRIRKYSCA